MLDNAKSGSDVEVDESHFKRLENLILIHIDIKGKNYNICDSEIVKYRGFGQIFSL